MAAGRVRGRFLTPRPAEAGSPPPRGDGLGEVRSCSKEPYLTTGEGGRRPGEGLPVSPDMRFDREIPTPGLIAPRHWYSNGLVGPRPTTSRGSTRPPPIPVPIRQAIFRLWQQGCGTRQIVASTGLPSPTVRRFLPRFRHRGRDGILADYRGPWATGAAPPEVV